MTRNEYIASIMLEAAELLREDSNDNEEVIFKKAYDECIKVIKPIIKDTDGVIIESFKYNKSDKKNPRYSFKTNKSHPISYVTIVDLDLYGFYGEEARDRYKDDNTKEFNLILTKLLKIMKPVAKKYGLAIEHTGYDIDDQQIILTKWKSFKD